MGFPARSLNGRGGPIGMQHCLTEMCLGFFELIRAATQRRGHAEDHHAEGKKRENAGHIHSLVNLELDFGKP